MNHKVEPWGSVTMWGFSPALDFQEDLCRCDKLPLNKQDTSSHKHLDVVNILSIGGGDCRHILKTMAQRTRHKKRKIHIYVIEGNLELVARHLLLLTLALEPKRRMGLQEKVELFLELYGNTLIRQHTLQYLQEKANLFIEMITDLDYADERMPTLDLSQLKYKERDCLEGLFKMWGNPDERNYNICNFWDLRLRHHLGRRYDTRSGAYDWDLMMTLHEHGAKMICKQEYTRFREKGIAFQCREGVYDRANKTMISWVHLQRRDGTLAPRVGYWGDTSTGPYITYGIDTHAKKLLKMANGKPSKSAQEITTYNLTCLFHELLTSEQYTGGLDDDDDDDDHKIMEVDDEYDVDDREKFMKAKAGSREFYAPIPCEEVCVHFLPFHALGQLHEKNKFKHFFNHIFVSASMGVAVNPALEKICAPHATLTVELVKYILDLKAANTNSFADSINKSARETGFRPRPPPADTPLATQECFLRFVLDSPEEDGGVSA